MSGTPQNEHPPSFANEGRGSDPLHGLLLDPQKTRSDIRMLTHAFKGKGPPAHHIEEIWNRLMLHLRTDAVREIDPDSGMSFLNDQKGAEISIKAAGMLGKFLEMFVKDEHLAMGLLAKKEEKGGDTYNIGCVGSIAMGQEPVSQDEAKQQAQQVLARVRARIGVQSPPAGENAAVSATEAVATASSLSDV